VFDEFLNVSHRELYSHFRQWCVLNGRRAVNSAEFSGRIGKLKGVGTTRPGTQGPRPRLFAGIAIRRRSI
jgi:hypothetical protein